MLLLLVLLLQVLMLLLLLLLLMLLMLVLLWVLLLMGSLQDLGRVVTWRTTVHARKRRLAMRKLLRRVALGRTLELRLLRRSVASRLVANALRTHHGLDFVQTHQLPSRGCLRGVLGRLGLILALRSLLRLLLGLEAPDIGTRLQLRNIFGVFVALITGPVGLRGLWDWRPVLLGGALTSLVQHLLFLHDVGDLGGLARKVEMLVDRLLELRAAKGVVVEGIVSVIERISVTIIGFLEVDAVRT
jgi:hypothetical protein